MASIIEKLRPRWVIGENVRGFINQPLGLKRSLSDLENLGYQAAPFIIPACAVDAKHRRDRVWIIAHSNSNSEPDGSVNEGTRSGELVADTDIIRLSGRTKKQIQRINKKSWQSIRRGEREPTRWTTEPAVGRVVNGFPGRMDRLKALGNAVVPQVVEQIGKAILTGEIK
jgi:DNA (cytosine-5)-methyltransferase 1